MASPRWSLALLAWGCCVTSLPAQGVIAVNPYVSNSGFSVRGSFGSSRSKGSIQITVGAISSRAYFVTPYPYPLTNPVTVVYYSPPPIYTPPPIVVVTPPRLLLDDLRPQVPPRVRPVERMPPADLGEDVVPFRPPERDRRPLPPEPPKPQPAPQAEPPPWIPPPEEREDERARLLRLGREAMAGGEYGRAAERFRQASGVAPREALPPLLLAQALLALGKYRDAVDALHTGLALERDWPASVFRPLELYGANVADYSEHLRRLEETLARYPDDPVLLFLNAYALWFDGRKDEARLLFRRALPGAPDPAVIERFLGAMPGTPVL
jgi:hypothetical protein